MINILGNFQKNKFTFLTAGFSVFTFLRDVEDVITHFFQNLKYLLIAFGFLSILLFYNFLKQRNQDINENCESKKVITKSIATQNNRSIFNTLSLKLAVLFCTAFLVFGVLSAYFIKNYPIYYVKVQVFKSEKEAIALMNKINESFTKHSEYKLRARCLTRSSNPTRFTDGNYMVSLNGGYLSEEKANKSIDRAKLVLDDQFNLYVTKPTRNISVIKKITYLMENN
jgi:hypothetical protein